MRGFAINSAGKPEALGEVCEQAGAVATATHDADGRLQWTVQLSDGSSTDTKTLASTTSWTPVDPETVPL